MKTKKLFPMLMLATTLLVACSDSSVNSTVDTKQWTLSAQMDSTVAPGDNFYMYCNGKWYNSTELGDNDILSLFDEALNMRNKRLTKLSHPAIITFLNDTCSFNKAQTIANSVELLKTMIHTYDNITTDKEAWDALAETTGEGLYSIFQPFLYNKSGKETFIYNSIDNIFDYNYVVSPLCLKTLGYTDEEVQKITDNVISAKTVIQPYAAKSAPHLDFDELDKSPEKSKLFFPLKELKTRGSGYSMLDEMTSVLKINPEYVYIHPVMVNYYNAVQTLSPEQIKSIIQSRIAQELIYVSQEAINDYSQTGGTKFTPDLVDYYFMKKYLAYIISYAYATTYITPENKARTLNVCEEFRSVMSSRIARLDWMSETTKANAQKKLADMRFNAGYPDEWIKEAMPELKGGLTEDILLLRKAHFSAFKTLIGENVQDNMFNEDLLDSPSKYFSINAFYISSINGLVILPAFLLQPFYDADASDAYNYGSFYTIGHEITHGFDSKGSKYNDIGDVEDWWTVADKMEFEKRYKLLIDCYNHLELYDGREELRGIYTDGTLTLTENIADLGGFNIAHEAYVNKLLKDGYSGEELDKQERKFYEAYANVWRSKQSIADIKKYLTDEHAFDKSRINGVVMNTDRWYELYNVKWGDKLYLKPEKRTYIW